MNDEIEALIAFRQQQGHWRVPAEHPLRAWEQERIAELFAGLADAEVTEALTEKGFPLTREAWLWEERFAELKEAVDLSGRAPSQLPTHQAWLYQQVRFGRRLAPDRKARLEAIGVSFERAQWPQPPKLLQPPRRMGRIPKKRAAKPAAKAAPRNEVRDPAAVTREELSRQGIAPAQIAAWIREGLLLQTRNADVFLKTRAVAPLLRAR